MPSIYPADARGLYYSVLLYFFNMVYNYQMLAGMAVHKSTKKCGMTTQVLGMQGTTTTNCTESRFTNMMQGIKLADGGSNDYRKGL